MKDLFCSRRSIFCFVSLALLFLKHVMLLNNIIVFIIYVLMREFHCLLIQSFVFIPPRRDKNHVARMCGSLNVVMFFVSFPWSGTVTGWVKMHQWLGGLSSTGDIEIPFPSSRGPSKLSDSLPHSGKGHRPTLLQNIVVPTTHHLLCWFVETGGDVNFATTVCRNTAPGRWPCSTK